MSDELERLRVELDVLERYAGNHVDIREAEKAVRLKIARLEAEAANPWKDVEALLEDWRDRLTEADFRFCLIKFFDHLTAERDRLAARVAELERANEPPFWPSESEIEAIKPQDEKAIMDAAVELMEGLGSKPDPDGPILDPARVLATAEGLMWGPTVYAVMLKPKDAKPYRLKGASE